MAHGTFSKSNGIVVDIRNSKSGLHLFEAVLWSDYDEESEYFFIGGLQHCFFLTIHNIPKKKDYKSYIGPITMFAEMIRGYSFSQRGITKFDAKILDRLITDNLSDAATTKTPVYIRKLFANFTNNVQRVVINMTTINTGQFNKRFCGYLLFKDVFFTNIGTENEYIRLSLLLQLFDRSLESIVILNVATVSNYKPSINLNPGFASTLLSGCKMINSNPQLKNTASKKQFKSIIIAKPRNSITQFITAHQLQFEAIGWTLEMNEYIHPRRGRCSEALHVSPL